MFSLAWLVRVSIPTTTRSRSQHSSALAREVADGVEAGEEVKQTTWHVIPSCAIVHVTSKIHVFNPSDTDAHVEVTESGEIYVKPLTYGRLIISYTGSDDE